jgi:uncharacterized protein
VAGPFRLQAGPAGELATYASATQQGAPIHGYALLLHDLPRPKGAAADVALTYPALADRLARESGWRVATASLRGTGESEGDFSALGWLDDLAFLASSEVPEFAPRLVVGFGFGGVLALHLAAGDERVAGVACLGTPAGLGPLAGDAEYLLARCRQTGVITTPGFPASVDTWAKELSVLHPMEDAAQLLGRPLLMVHGSDDPEVPLADARALAEAATGPSELHTVLGAGHWLRADPRVIAILVGWLERRH